jgi:prevent-host-death family protein
MQYIDVTQVQTQLINLLNQAASGKEVVITKDNQPFVKLVPIIQSHPLCINFTLTPIIFDSMI